MAKNKEMKPDINKTMSKCFKNNIKIYPVPEKGYEGRQRPPCTIHVSMNDRVYVLEEIFKQDKKLQDKIEELYYYYSQGL